MGNVIKNSLVALVLVAAATVLPNVTVFAEEEEIAVPETQMTISPLRARLSIEPGNTYSGTGANCPVTNEKKCTLEVSNTGQKAFSFRVYASPYAVTGEETLNITESSTYTQIARWIKFQNESGEWVDEFTRRIEPGEMFVVNYQITVPDDIPAGSQYAAIWAQTLPDEELTSTGVQTISQAGLTVTATGLGDTREEAEISNYRFNGFTMSGDLTASATVKNTGNTDFTVNYTYTGRSLFGRELYKSEKQITAYPEVELDLTANWENRPWFGLFTANWTVEAADVVENHTKVVLIMPFPMLIITLLLLTALGFWIRIIVRKRKERTLNKLV